MFAIKKNTYSGFKTFIKDGIGKYDVLFFPRYSRWGHPKAKVYPIVSVAASIPVN